MIHESVSSGLLTGSKRVYLVLYDNKGNRVDNEAILSQKHMAVPTISYGNAYFVYTPPEEWNLSDGMYDLEIYNESGELIRKTIVFLSNE